MLNRPKKIKYNLHHNITKPNTFKNFNNLIKHDTALIAIENGIINAGQLNSAIFSIKRKLKETNSLLIRVFPHLPVTKRPLEMPLGRGKATVSYWATTVKCGSIIFELSTNQTILTNNALKAAAMKLPIKTKIVNKPKP